MKSGTSLLRKLLSSHPEIYGGMETHWCSEDFKNTWTTGEGTRQEWLLKFFDTDTDVANEFRDLSNSSNEFFTKFMDHVTQRNNKIRWVEKTPDNFRHVPEILKQWPGAHVIILKRDPLDVYASWKKNNKYSLERFIQDLKQYRAVVQEFKSEPRFKIVQYEELVSDSKAVLMDVFDFISAEYKEGIENYSGDDEDFLKVLEVTGKRSPTTESLRKPIFDSSIGQYAEILTPEEIKAIRSAC